MIGRHKDAAKSQRASWRWLVERANLTPIIQLEWLVRLESHFQAEGSGQLQWCARQGDGTAARVLKTQMQRGVDYGAQQKHGEQRSLVQGESIARR